MRSVVGMKVPSSAFAVGWSPLLLLLLLRVVEMGPVSLPKLQTPEAVSKLINDSSVKFDLLNYFAELKLQDGCTSPLINECNFLDSLMSHYESSMCTIIYNITKELEDRGKDMPDDLVKSLLKNSTKSEDMWFTVWKNVSKISQSPSLNLLMKHLNETKKWKSVCYNFDGNLFPYCKFLHYEVLLLQNFAAKEPPVKSNALINNITMTDRSTISNNASENSKDSQMPTISPTSINFNLEDNENKDDGDDDFLKPDDLAPPITQINNENKIPNSVDKNEDENLNIINSSDKIAQPIFSSSNKLTNHQEESHFLFYFIIMTVFSMMFYLALYNKKKIIALLIEGRRSTSHRRRPNSTSYSKVETDDANTVY